MTKKQNYEYYKFYNKKNYAKFGDKIRKYYLEQYYKSREAISRFKRRDAFVVVDGEYIKGIKYKKGYKYTTNKEEAKVYSYDYAMHLKLKLKDEGYNASVVVKGE